MCDAGIRVRTTSTDASWKDPNRVGSLEPMTVPSGSVIRMPSPVAAAFSAATDWASDEVSIRASVGLDESYSSGAASRDSTTSDLR